LARSPCEVVLVPEAHNRGVPMQMGIVYVVSCVSTVCRGRQVTGPSCTSLVAGGRVLCRAVLCVQPLLTSAMQASGVYSASRSWPPFRCWCINSKLLSRQTGSSMVPYHYMMLVFPTIPPRPMALADLACIPGSCYASVPGRAVVLSHCAGEVDVLQQ
jgi:hypothetical protein